MLIRKLKIFDDADGFGTITNIATLADPSVVKRGDQWWMFVAGLNRDTHAIDLFSARLPEGVRLGASGWTIDTVPGNPTKAAALLPPFKSGEWDGAGGRHCPCYVKGWDPTAKSGKGAWRERLYYSGASGGFTGPYQIGFAEWNGSAWHRCEKPALLPSAAWEGNSIAEPNVIYSGGKWRAFYSAITEVGPAKHFTLCYAESDNGIDGWEKRHIIWPREEEVFDQAVAHQSGGYAAIIARDPFGSSDRNGLWWMRAGSSTTAGPGWADQVHLLNGKDGSPWHSVGVWRPSFQIDPLDPETLYVFFNGQYPSESSASTGRPFHLAIGCLEYRLR